MSESIVAELIVGHSCTRLSSIENGHTHRWTLYVKPANKQFEYFTDNKIIQKVKFELHPTFPDPIRVVSKPPFKITATGFASFVPVVTIYWNLPNQKPHTVHYELFLFPEKEKVQDITQKFLLRGDGMSSGFRDQVKLLCKTKKRKASVISSNDEKSPPDFHAKKNRRDRIDESPLSDKYEKEKHKSSSSSKPKKPKDLIRDVPMIIPKIEIERTSDHPRKESKSEAEKKKRRSKSPEPSQSERVKSPEELTKKLNDCSDPYVIYKASEFLLTLPSTTLNAATLRLSYDLTKCKKDTLLEIGRILKMKKKPKN